MVKLTEQNLAMVETAGGESTVAETSNSPCPIRGIRYIILITTLICLASIMSNIVTFNFTVLCIRPQSGKELTNGINE
ncbi:unnamed protein product, partial [Onchocerca ochengi]